MALEKKKTFHCNVEVTLDIIGGKWKPLIIYHLGKSEVLRFGEFKRKIPGINERVLSRLLRELEKHLLISRQDYHENPPKVEYALTDLGKSLSPIIIELGDWGKQYNQDFSYGEIDFESEDYDEC